MEFRPGYIFQTNSFLKGENEKWKPIDRSLSTHLRYSFQLLPHTLAGQVYNSPYQGIGLGYYNFNEPKFLGNPIALYLFQGARIAKFNSRLSLNYEWNFGLSFGWKPYDFLENYYNVIIGSKTNAYLNVGVHLNWMLAPNVDLITGFTLSHFSNGNTNFPNAGLNTADVKIGLVYNFNPPRTPGSPNRCLNLPFQYFGDISVMTCYYSDPGDAKELLTEINRLLLPINIRYWDLTLIRCTISDIGSALEHLLMVYMMGVPMYIQKIIL